MESRGGRAVGGPMAFAVVYSAVGFTLYFALGVVAQRGLGLTPLIFLAAGLMVVLATLTYAEGSATFLDRGGSANLARHGFNELVSFIAAWALLIDLIVIVALAAVSVPHYLAPIWDGFRSGIVESSVAVAVVALVAFANIVGWWGRRRFRALVALAIGDLVIQVLLIVVGVAVVFEPELLTRHLDLFESPSLEDAIYALVLATVAFAGVEAAADLAPDLDWRIPDLRRSLTVGAATVPVLYAGVAVIALMAVPVVVGPGGPGTALGDDFIENPVLGVAQSFEPAWVSDVMQVAVVAVAPAVLIWAASTAMLGVSRHSYVLATNRQIPSWLGTLGARFGTPHVAIVVAALIAAGLTIPSDIELLAAIYAFGATLAIAIAHASLLRLRARQPDRPRPFRVPFNVRVRGVELPLPALAGFAVTGLAWLSVLAFHSAARWVGLAWMAFGVIAYVIYRVVVEETSLTERVEVPAAALTKQPIEIEYDDILVPIFDSRLDDDIVSTAGRLAAAARTPGAVQPRLRILYVVDLPVSVPLTAAVPAARMEAANAALARAGLVAEEYETVDVQQTVVKARTVGAGIVQTARNLGVQMIVMGGEPPTRIRGGAVLGGVGGHRPDEIGPVTEYVLSKAPCRVLVTAPPDEPEAGAEGGTDSRSRPVPE